MLKLASLIFLLSSSICFAHLEHVSGQGHVPGAKRLEESRGCFQEIEKLGCSHPRNGTEIFRTCLADKKEQLSLNCQKFFEGLYKE